MEDCIIIRGRNFNNYTRNLFFQVCDLLDGVGLLHKKHSHTLWCFRGLHDSLPHPPGPGGNAAPAVGVRHRPAPQEGTNRCLDLHQPLPHWNRYGTGQRSHV